MSDVLGQTVLKPLLADMEVSRCHFCALEKPPLERFQPVIFCALSSAIVEWVPGPHASHAHVAERNWFHCWYASLEWLVPRLVV